MALPCPQIKTHVNFLYMALPEPQIDLNTFIDQLKNIEPDSRHSYIKNNYIMYEETYLNYPDVLKFFEDELERLEKLRRYAIMFNLIYGHHLPYTTD